MVVSGCWPITEVVMVMRGCCPATNAVMVMSGCWPEVLLKPLVEIAFGKPICLE